MKVIDFIQGKRNYKIWASDLYTGRYILQNSMLLKEFRLVGYRANEKR